MPDPNLMGRGARLVGLGRYNDGWEDRNLLTLSLSHYRMRNVTNLHAWLLVLLAYLLSSIVFLESIFIAERGFWAPPVSRCLSVIYRTHSKLMMWNAILPVNNYYVHMSFVYYTKER